MRLKRHDSQDSLIRLNLGSIYRRVTQLILTLFVILSIHVQVYGLEGDLSLHAFDWDNNVFEFHTSDSAVLVYPKRGKTPQRISTAEFAKLKESIGKKGAWKNYELRSNSFQAMRDENGKNSFLHSIRHALDAEDPKHLPQDIQKPRKAGSFQGPMWNKFVQALSQPETARYVSIITARGHDPHRILEGLKELQKRGWIRHLPLEQNIFSVNHPDFIRKFPVLSAKSSTQTRKTMVMQYQLDQLQKHVLEKSLPLSATWTFSDDDFINFKEARDHLARLHQMQPLRWQNLFIELTYTGPQRNDIAPHVVVSQSCTPGYCALPVAQQTAQVAPHLASQIHGESETKTPAL